MYIALNLWSMQLCTCNTIIIRRIVIGEHNRILRRQFTSYELKVNTIAYDGDVQILLKYNDIVH